MRVVSLLPSATEVLCAIGGRDRLVGRSHECDWPADVRDLPALTGQRVDPSSSISIDEQARRALAEHGSLYTLDEDRLASLRPDVILTQSLCEVCSIDLRTVERVAAALPSRPGVVDLNPPTFEAVLDDHLRVGEAVGLESAAERAVVALRERMHVAADYVNPYADAPNVLFVEWADPVFVGGHWTPQLIERAGGAHPLNPTAPKPGAGAGAGHHGAFRETGASMQVDLDAVIASRPDVVIIAPCGVPLDQVESHAAPMLNAAWFADTPAARSDRVALVDGSQMFNRPGPRLVDAFEWLVGYLNERADLVPKGFPWRPLGA